MTDTLTEDEREQYEREWQELDEKVLLAQILAELQQLRVLLSGGVVDDEIDDAEKGYRCERCDRVVPADDRERHAQERHRAPPGAEMGLFSEVDE